MRLCEVFVESELYSAVSSLIITRLAVIDHFLLQDISAKVEQEAKEHECDREDAEEDLCFVERWDEEAMMELLLHQSLFLSELVSPSYVLFTQ